MYYDRSADNFSIFLRISETSESLIACRRSRRYSTTVQARFTRIQAQLNEQINDD